LKPDIVQEEIMQWNRSKKLFFGIAIIAIVGLAATAFAEWGRGAGRGFGPGACGGPGGGFGKGGYNCPAAFDELSDEQIDRINEMRTQFFDDTRDLKDQIYQKRLELQSELARPEPEKSRALKLQKEVSELKNEMAQKRLEQRLELKKEFPELADSGFGRGYGRGRGWGMQQDGQERGYGMWQGGRGYGRGGGCRY
jgi:Spy/CpxP family protein refolding chaperone